MKPAVLYDGNCSLCRGQVERLRRWDRAERLEYLSLHDPQVGQRFPHLRREDLMRELHVVEVEGHAHRGAGAVRFLSRALPALWWAAPFLHVPGSLPFWQWLYHRIARSRYGRCSPSGPGSTCATPNQSDR